MNDHIRKIYCRKQGNLLKHQKQVTFHFFRFHHVVNKQGMATHGDQHYQPYPPNSVEETIKVGK